MFRISTLMKNFSCVYEKEGLYFSMLDILYFIERTEYSKWCLSVLNKKITDQLIILINV